MDPAPTLVEFDGGGGALGGALGRVDPDATAIGERTAPFLLEILANWAAPEETEAQRRLGTRLLQPPWSASDAARRI